MAEIAPLPNDAATRTPDGTIKDQATTAAATTPPPTTPTAEKAPASTEKKDDPSLLNQDKPPETKAAEGAPEKYEPFTVPEGYQLDEKAGTDAQALFKELGLPQAAAQRLIDLYAKTNLESAEAPFAAFREMKEDWRKQVMDNPKLGPRIAAVRENIGRALDFLGNPALTTRFREAMDVTGAGDHPAFVEAFDALAQAVIEGKHVSGRGPSAAGQQKPNAPDGPSAAALWPTLRSSQPQRG